MSTQQPQQQVPTQDQIREARHTGFVDSVQHMPEAQKNKLTNAYATQDNRREKNISDFYGNVLGN